MSARHTTYLKVLRERRDSLPRDSGSWKQADLELRAVADAFHSTDDIGFVEMLSYMDSTKRNDFDAKYPDGSPMYGSTIKENGDPIMLAPDGKRSIFCDIDE